MINADVVDNPLFAFEHERKFWNYKTFPILATIWLECYVLFLLDIVTCSIGLDIENANLKWMIQSVNCWLLHSNHCFQAANCWLEHHNCWLERCSKLWQHLNWREKCSEKFGQLNLATALFRGSVLFRLEIENVPLKKIHVPITCFQHGVLFIKTFSNVKNCWNDNMNLKFVSVWTWQNA